MTIAVQDAMPGKYIRANFGPLDGDIKKSTVTQDGFIQI